MPELSSLDPLAILVAGVLSGALGALWYSGAMLGPAWMSALGKREDELTLGGAEMGGSIFSYLVAASAIEILTTLCGVDTAIGGAGLGALLGLGIVAMTMLSDSLFSAWGWKLYFIQMSYRATYLVLMGAICGGWPW